MARSRVASNARLTPAGNKLTVSASMVLTARLWAGLRPGKNFSTPNQKNTIPNVTRSVTTP